MAVYDFPTNIDIASISVSAKNAVGVNQSQFTYKQQVYEYEGQNWEMTINFPPMKLNTAEELIGFLTRLNGRSNLFNLIHPETVRQTLDTNTNNQTLRIDAPNSTLSQLRLTKTVGGLSFVPVGTWISIPQINTVDGQTVYRLHKVTNEGTETTLYQEVDIWPYLRGDIDDWASETVFMQPNALKGTWRLKSNVFTYDVNQASLYGMSVACEGYVQ